MKIYEPMQKRKKIYCSFTEINRRIWAEFYVKYIHKLQLWIIKGRTFEASVEVLGLDQVPLDSGPGTAQ